MPVTLSPGIRLGRLVLSPGAEVVLSAAVYRSRVGMARRPYRCAGSDSDMGGAPLGRRWLAPGRPGGRADRGPGPQCHRGWPHGRAGSVRRVTGIRSKAARNCSGNRQNSAPGRPPQTGALTSKGCRYDEAQRNAHSLLPPGRGRRRGPLLSLCAPGQFRRPPRGDVEVTGTVDARRGVGSVTPAKSGRDL